MTRSEPESRVSPAEGEQGTLPPVAQLQRPGSGRQDTQWRAEPPRSPRVGQGGVASDRARQELAGVRGGGGGRD